MVRKNKKSMIVEGQFLKQKRIEAEFTQREVAELFGYSTVAFVSNWERGLISPPIETIRILVKIYKIQKTELINLFADCYKASLKESLSIDPKPLKKKKTKKKIKKKVDRKAQRKKRLARLKKLLSSK